MLGFYFIFVLAASYLSCVSCVTDREYWKHKYLACQYGREWPREIPRTADELRSICRLMKELGECVLSEGIIEETEATNQLRQFFEYLNDICRENNEVFLVISSNLQCISSASKRVYSGCDAITLGNQTHDHELMAKAKLQYREKMQIGGDEEIHDDDHSCLYRLLYNACLSAKTGVRCGFEVGVAVKDILNKAEFFHQCTDTFSAEITPIIDDLESGYIEDNDLETIEEEVEGEDEEEEEEERVEKKKKKRVKKKKVMKKQGLKNKKKKMTKRKKIV